MRRASKVRFAILLVPRNAIRNKWVQFGNPEIIRANRTICATLRIDSRESGHPAYKVVLAEACTFFGRGSECQNWVASIRHLMLKPSATASRKFGWKLSYDVMPKVLVLKAQGRHVMWCFLASFGGVFGGWQKGGLQKSGFGGCSPGTKTGTRVHSDVPPEWKPERGYVCMFPPERKPERGYVRQSHPLRNPLLFSCWQMHYWVHTLGDFCFLGLDTGFCVNPFLLKSIISTLLSMTGSTPTPWDPHLTDQKPD